MATGFEVRRDHSTFLRENPGLCKSLLKDFVTSGGDWSSSELSPAIRDDPQLQEQCRKWGYMIIQIGDQLRQVYCGTPTLGHTDEGADCPQCGQPYCMQHLAEHLGATLVDPTSLQIGDTPGANPNPYSSMPLGSEPRYDTSTWDNAEYHRNSLNELKAERTGASLSKAMWSQIHVAEKTQLQKAQGEHTLSPEQIMALDPVSRLVFEVWAYMDEYKAPASTADIAVELSTRGIDEAFQNQLEQAAHANEDWLPKVLEELANLGYIGRSKDGGWVPISMEKEFNPDQPRDEHGRWMGGAGGVEDMLPSNTKVKINAPGMAYHGETGKVLYSTQPTGAKERNYIVEMGDGKKVLRIGSQVEPTEPIPAAPKPVEAPAAPTPGSKIPVEGAPRLTRIPVGIGGEGPGIIGVPKWTGEVETTGPGAGFPAVGSHLYSDSQYTGQEQLRIDSYESGGTRGPWAHVTDVKTGDSHVVHSSDLRTDQPPPKISRSLPFSQIISSHIRERAAQKGHPLSDTQAEGAPKIEGVTITHWEPAKGGKDLGERTQYNPATGDIETVHPKTIAYGEKEVREALDHLTPAERQGVKIEVWDDKTITAAERYYGIKGGHADASAFQLGGGMYLTSDKRLFVGRFTDTFLKHKEVPGVGPYIGGTLIHETEHHVWFTRLSKDERDEFQTHWFRNSDKFKQNVGPYSARNYKEGWSEASRYYKLNPTYLKEKMPSTYDLVHKIHTRINEHPEVGQEGGTSIFD